MATPITPRAVIKQKRDAAAVEYEAATKGLKFSKDFNTNLEALIHDPMSTWAERLMCWLKRYAWGEYSLFAIRMDGEPRTLIDAAKDLCKPEDKFLSVKSRLYHTAKYLEARNYLRRDGKKLFPVIAPQVPPPSKRYPPSATFSAFMEHYKVAHSDTFAEYEIARSVIKTIRKMMISDFKKYRERVLKCAGSEYLSDDVTLFPKIKEEKGDIHAHEAVVTNAADGARVSPPLPPTERTAPAAGAPSPAESCTHPQLLLAAAKGIPRPLPYNQSNQEIPPQALKRLDEFLAYYPDKSDPASTARAYAKHVTPETEDACHACLGRYLASDRVSRNVVQRGRNWIEQQGRNGFHGQWAPPPASQRKAVGFEESVTKVLAERIQKRGKPW